MTWTHGKNLDNFLCLHMTSWWTLPDKVVCKSFLVGGVLLRLCNVYSTVKLDVVVCLACQWIFLRCFDSSMFTSVIWAEVKTLPKTRRWVNLGMWLDDISKRNWGTKRKLRINIISVTYSAIKLDLTRVFKAAFSRIILKFDFLCYLPPSTSVGFSLWGAHIFNWVRILVVRTLMWRVPRPPLSNRRHGPSHNLPWLLAVLLRLSQLNLLPKSNEPSFLTHGRIWLKYPSDTQFHWFCGIFLEVRLCKIFPLLSSSLCCDSSLMLRNGNSYVSTINLLDFSRVTCLKWCLW